MLLHSLEVASFRLFSEKQVWLEHGINCIVGSNAIGKTTLLEAIYLLTCGRSFRSAHTLDLVQQGADFFRIDGRFEKNGVNQRLTMSMQSTPTGQERRLQYNSTELPSLAALLGILQGVLLAPHDIDLIKGTPQVRRHFLDLQISQIDPLYVHHLIRYTKGLKQRNWMLRTKQLSALDAYDASLAAAAAYLISCRSSIVQALETKMQAIYQIISGRKEELSLRYHSSIGSPEQEKIIAKWHQTHAKDIEMGVTGCGPHRDELRITLRDKEAKQFASEGEMRSLAAALKLAEWQQMHEISHEKPLLLVDDLGISLDAFRLNNLAELFLQLGQVIITSTNPCDHLLKKSQMILIR